MLDRTANEMLFDLALLRAETLRQFSNGEVRKIFALFERDLIPALRARLLARLQRVGSRGLDASFATERMRDVLRGAYAVIAEKLRKIKDVSREGLIEMAKREARWQLATLERSIPASITLREPNLELIRSVVTSRPFQGKLLREWYVDLERSARSRVVQGVRTGIALGETSEDIVRGLLGAGGSFSATRRDLESIVRTSITHVSSHARQVTVDQNASVIKGMQWHATLDLRTTPICQKRDGKVFPVDSGPRPPAHFRCRSTMVPVMKSWKELGIDLKEAPEGTRASMDGQIPQSVNYGKWLKSRSKEEIEHVLGKRRAKAFLEGRSLESLIGKDGRFVSVDSL